MSLPSFKLSKRGDGIWTCSGTFESGKPFDFEVGPGTREFADAQAQVKLAQKVAGSRGSHAYWQARREGKLPPPAKKAASTSPPRATDDELRAKLIGLGDAKPLEADQVIPADADGEPAGAPDDEDGPRMSGKSRKFLSVLFAKLATKGAIEIGQWPQRRRKPPREGEPNEDCEELFEEGAQETFHEMLGNAKELTPFQKMAVGMFGISLSIWASAVPIDPPPAAAAARPAPAPPPPAAEPTHQNGYTPAPPQPPQPAAPLALGAFGVEKMTVGN